MPVVEILQGLPASGKSTHAKEKVAQHSDWVRINKDDTRSMLHSGVYSGSREKTVVRARDALISTFMHRGLNIIIDDTNLNPIHVDHIKQMVKDHNVVAQVKTGNKPWPIYHVEVKFFDIELEEAVKRDLKRPVSVGRDVIEKMYYEWIFKPEPIQFNEGAPYAVLCDLDGTLALFDGRGPYDWMKCETDKVSEPVLAILHLLKLREAEAYTDDDYTKIIIMSGRDEECRVQTENWLKINNVPYDALIMRAEGDTRPDDLIKRELFDKYIRHDFNVKFVLDDRRRVKRMWVGMGIYVFDCNQTSAIF